MSYGGEPSDLERISSDYGVMVLDDDSDDNGDDYDIPKKTGLDSHCSPDMQDAIFDIYDALSSTWPEACDPPYQAMLRLKAHHSVRQYGIAEGVELDIFFLSHNSKWVENEFIIK